MPSSYLSYVGIRVTDLERSPRFYAGALGLKEVGRGDNSPLGGGQYVLLQDSWSDQRLELNWYPPRSPFAAPDVPGEALDHLAFRVANLPSSLELLQKAGARRDDRSGDHRLPDGAPVAYVQDPHGIWLGVYGRPGPLLDDPLEGY